MLDLFFLNSVQRPYALPLRCSRWPGLSNHWGVGKLDAGAPPYRGAAGSRVAQTGGRPWHSFTRWSWNGTMPWATHKSTQWKVRDFIKKSADSIVSKHWHHLWLFVQTQRCTACHFVSSLLPGLDWIERENFLDVHLTRNRPPPARRRRSGPSQRTSYRRTGLDNCLRAIFVTSELS